MALYVVTGRKPGSNLNRYNLNLPEKDVTKGKGKEGEEGGEGAGAKEVL